jgi:hypothetical protein
VDDPEVVAVDVVEAHPRLAREAPRWYAK